MKLTNNNNLPEIIVKVIENDPYDGGRGRISTTKLIDSPRIFHLSNRYWDELTEDVSGKTASVFGQAVHTLLERAYTDDRDDLLVEKRFHAEVDGVKFGGQVDVWDRGHLIDWKTTSGWAAMKKATHLGWERQANVNAWLLRQHGYRTDRTDDVVFLKDWAKRYTYMKTYPKTSIIQVSLPVWSDQEQDEYVSSRIKLFRDSGKLSDEDLPFCTDEERWVNSKGLPLRCSEYCPLKTKCNQYQETQC